jgi:RNA polymerase sigma-70 factor, ECF subfamily
MTVEGSPPRARVIDGDGGSTGFVDLDARFEGVRPRLLRTAMALVGYGSAEDVVHDTYLVARARIRQLRDPAALEAWLVQICVRRCFRLARRARHLDRMLAERPAANAAPAAPWLEMRELIERLAPRDRTVVVLHDGYGHTFAEIAALLGISHDNARTIASRARRSLLRAWLEAER